ncbi:hypothetical protein H4R19_001892 [Coemansia spiralis]|nr:hypothetical protein H4R19_001892 [Coemansia spiralis]
MDDPNGTGAPQQQPAGSAVATMKLPLHVVWRKEAPMAALQQHVERANFLTTHTMQFARYIFLYEMGDDDFNAADYINDTFFREVFLHLTTRECQKPKKETTQTMRNLIALYIEDYMALAGIEKTPFVNAGSTAGYEAIRITTAYKNNISLRFGDNLRAAVNVLLRVREERERLRREMQGQGQAAIRTAIREQITGPATLAKRAVMGGVHGMSVLNAATREALRPLEAVFATYPLDRVFVDNNVEADSQLHPEHHLKAFYVLAGVLQRHRDNRCTPQCFPLRRGWVPAHTHIDTQILKRDIFNEPSNCSSNYFNTWWGRAVNLKHRAFKPSSDKSFSWSIDTDGVAVSILKKTAAERDRYKGGQKLEEGQIAKPKHTQRHKRKRPPSDDNSKAPVRRGATLYIHQIPRQELIDTTGKCVLLDPGRRDELHGLHKDSTPDHKMTFHLTHRQVVVQRRMARFRKILQMAKKQYTGGDVQEAERELAKVSCTTLDPHEFEDYIVAWLKVWGLLSTFYSSAQTVHVGSHHQFHTKRAPSGHSSDRYPRQQPARLISTWPTN